MRKIAVESGMFPDWFIPAFETSSFLICFSFQYSLNIIYNYWLTGLPREAAIAITADGRPGYI